MAEPGKAPYPPEQPSDDGAQLLGSNSVIAVRMGSVSRLAEL